MAVSGEVSVRDDCGLKLQPYLIALARWCVSCLWSSATTLLYRLLTSPLPQIMASKPSKPRPAGREHLHPEPRVQCAVLHQPPAPRVDVIFVHGLYGSLGNTWRQGEWRSKYKIEPNKISLRRPSSIPTCDCDRQTNQRETTHADNCNKDFSDYLNNEAYIKMENEAVLNDAFKNIDDYYKKSITDDEVFIAEKFYESVDRCEVISNYETQAKFVSDLFTMENLKDQKKEVDVACSCQNGAKVCEVGCGCVCDGCYSPCWPRDWLREDHPGARVISVNYTSDPHLWRPLWIKQSKRLQMHERAEQMIEQLLELGVGERPIVWVGHSKGGLFIKQIYCEAYEAYLKLNGQTNENEQNCDEYDKDNEMNHKTDNTDEPENNNRIDNKEDFIENTGTIDIYESVYGETMLNYNDVKIKDNSFKDILKEDRRSSINKFVENDSNMDGEEAKRTDNGCLPTMVSSEEDVWLSPRARLWQRSGGFMFYSVPHRGSPLADIKAPLTARSVELLEMGQDCSELTQLHARWLRAAAPATPRVRSLVETNRTLMAVLWLRIVSVDSADAGIGALCGVSVDHREICKPSSRQCILYKELTSLVHAALNKCQQ